MLLQAVNARPQQAASARMEIRTRIAVVRVLVLRRVFAAFFPFCVACIFTLFSRDARGKATILACARKPEEAAVCCVAVFSGYMFRVW